jgi:hypothetical protein
MPNLPAGSAAVPLKTRRFTCATGTLCSSTIQTGSPLESCRFWICGSFSAGGGPASGGWDRSGACCAASAEAANIKATAMNRRRMLLSRSW